jgi:DNA-binding GntR family transcriptional regulator
MAAVRQRDPAERRVDDRAPVTSRVYRHMLAEIVLGDLPPGRELCLQTLAQRYVTSSASVRQALLRLVGERLVEAESAMGFNVASASADDLLDLVKTLEWLTGIGMRESIANGDAHWEADVLAAQHAFIQSLDGPGLLRRSELPFAGERFLEYQDSLIAACRSTDLLRFCRSLNLRLLRYRNLAGVHASQEREWAVRMRNAAMSRDTALAGRHLTHYYRFTADRVIRSGCISAS